MKFKLRDYQQRGVEEIRGQYRDGKKAVLYVLPTGGGKTVTYAHIAEQAGAKGNRVLILEHRKELIRQASLASGGLGLHHRIVAPQNKIIDIRRAHVGQFGQPYIDQNGDVAVASVQTLARRISWLQEFDPAMIIIDEAHHAVAGTWARIIEALPKAKLLGVTATPCRTDGQGLGDVFDSMVLGPSMEDLIESGSLVPPRIFAPPLRADLSSVHRSKGDLRTDEQADILDQPTIIGDAVNEYRKLAAHRPAIVFCCNVKHAKHVAEQFRAAGFKFYAIFGDMDDGERDRLIYGLADGSVEGLVSVDVISEGTDIPVAEVAIMLRATESESLFLQQAGRVLRPADGKEYGLIIDHVGNVMRHGKPHDDRSWTLDGRQKRGSNGEKGEAAVKILQCPECYLVHDPAPTCPQCGHHYEARVFQPRHLEGELVEMVETDEERERRLARKEQGRAKDVDALVKLGHSKSRAEHIIAARQEKERLQAELKDLLVRWARQTDRTVNNGWGYGMSDIRTMKPKALRENIEKVSESLFHGDTLVREQIEISA